jgi:hypothetical protein
MPKRIMLAGAIARAGTGFAGNTWAFLQYILGLRRLGCEPYYVEQIDATDCVNAQYETAPFVDSINVKQFRTFVQRFDLGEHAGLLTKGGSEYIGLSLRQLEKLAPDIDLLINLSGNLHLESLFEKIRPRMYLDMDPGYTQIWQEQYGVDMNLRDHDLYVTVGLNFGKPDCPLPTGGVQWHSTLPPVVLPEWTTDCSPGTAYSTIADWRGFEPVEWRGVWYGQKAGEFLRLINLPDRVPVPLEICLFIHPDEGDKKDLLDCGWRLLSPDVCAATLDTYRSYIFGSRGEFTAVKQGYAAGRTGWFSDRSACYLAAGRPVITQDTGIGKYLPCGAGLLTFTDIESAAEAIELVESDYSAHSVAARAFACEFLDSDVVLHRLLGLAGV